MMNLARKREPHRLASGHEITLWQGVLQEAFLCALGQGNPAERDVREARAWFARRYSDSPPAGTFEWCCLMLGLSAERIRRRLRICLLLRRPAPNPDPTTLI